MPIFCNARRPFAAPHSAAENGGWQTHAHGTSEGLLLPSGAVSWRATIFPVSRWDAINSGPLVLGTPALQARQVERMAITLRRGGPTRLAMSRRTSQGRFVASVPTGFCFSTRCRPRLPGDASPVTRTRRRRPDQIHLKRRRNLNPVDVDGGPGRAKVGRLYTRRRSAWAKRRRCGQRRLRTDWLIQRPPLRMGRPCSRRPRTWRPAARGRWI